MIGAFGAEYQCLWPIRRASRDFLHRFHRAQSVAPLACRRPSRILHLSVQTKGVSAMAAAPKREGVHIIDTARFNAMLGVCESARIWSRSAGEDKSRAERALLRALTAYTELPD